MLLALSTFQDLHSEWWKSLAWLEDTLVVYRTRRMEHLEPLFSLPTLVSGHASSIDSKPWRMVVDARERAGGRGVG